MCSKNLKQLLDLIAKDRKTERGRSAERVVEKEKWKDRERKSLVKLHIKTDNMLTYA